MTTQQLINRLTFQNVQAMFSSYCTLKPDHVLLDDLEQILPDSEKSVINVRDFYNQAILKKYPNETSIKASFLNHVLFKKRRDITIFELPVGGSRVDLCKINGTSVAYEIKTDLDNLKRLDKQVLDYQRVFEQVYIICSFNRVSEVEDILPDNCGIYTYSFSSRKQYQFQKHREANKTINFDSKQQLLLFWVNELQNIFPDAKHLGKAKSIEHLLSIYSVDQINSLFKEMLRHRYGVQWSFLEANHRNIYEIDYQWFYQNKTNPKLIYGI